MSSDIQGTKKTAIVLGLIAAGLLALGVHQNNRWMIGGSIGLGAFTGMGLLGIIDEEKQKLNNALDLARLEGKPFSARYFAGMSNAEVRQKRKAELKALNLSELKPEYLESLSDEERQLVLEAKTEQDTEKAVNTTAGIGVAAVGLAIFSVFLGGD